MSCIQSDVQRLLILELIYVNWHIELKLDFASVTYIKQDRKPFVPILVEGWVKWLSDITEAESLFRTRRDTGSILGGIGASLGLMNMANTKVMMNKLSQAARQLQEVKEPITSSLSEIGHQAMVNVEVLPIWHQADQLEQILALKTIEKSQNDMSLALSCAQAQSWVQTIINGIIRQGYSGTIPLKLNQLIMEVDTRIEMKLRNW